MDILLAGASGFLGRAIADDLALLGHRVRPVCRRQGTDFRTLQTEDSWRSLLQGVEAVINCVGIIAERDGQTFDELHYRAPAALFRACSAIGVRRVIQISALGADESAVSRYHQSKYAADNLLRSLDLDGFVLRPSLVFGPGGRSTQWFVRLASLPLIPVVGDGRQKVAPVHVDDLVLAVRRCLELPPCRRTINVVGPKVYAFGEWLQALRAAQGLQPTSLLHVPVRLASTGLRVGRYFSPLLEPDNLQMLLAGNWDEPEAFTRFLARSPRAVLAEAGKRGFAAIEGDRQ